MAARVAITCSHAGFRGNRAGSNAAARNSSARNPANSSASCPSSIAANSSSRTTPASTPSPSDRLPPPRLRTKPTAGPATPSTPAFARCRLRSAALSPSPIPQSLQSWVFPIAPRLAEGDPLAAPGLPRSSPRPRNRRPDGPATRAQFEGDFAKFQALQILRLPVVVGDCGLHLLPAAPSNQFEAPYLLCIDCCPGNAALVHLSRLHFPSAPPAGWRLATLWQIRISRRLRRRAYHNCTQHQAPSSSSCSPGSVLWLDTYPRVHSDAQRRRRIRFNAASDHTSVPRAPGAQLLSSATAQSSCSNSSKNIFIFDATGTGRRELKHDRSPGRPRLRQRYRPDTLLAIRGEQLIVAGSATSVASTGPRTITIVSTRKI